MTRCSFVAVLVLMAGCASAGLHSVQDERWQVVPGEVRAKIERVQAPLVSQAIEERRLAAAALVEARAALDRCAATPLAHPPAALPPGVGDDAWRATWMAHQQAEQQALAQIDASKRAWLGAMIRWRERRLAAAELRVDVARAGFELARAQAVEGYTPSEQGYDSAAYRGQFARLHQAWSAAHQRAVHARADTERLSRELAGTKEQYAQLRRERPGAPPPITEARYFPRVPHIF